MQHATRLVNNDANTSRDTKWRGLFQWARHAASAQPIISASQSSQPDHASRFQIRKIASEPQIRHVAGSGTGAGCGANTDPPVFVAGPLRLGVFVEVVQKPPDDVSMTVEVDVDALDELAPESGDWVLIGLVDPVEDGSELVAAEF